MLIQLLAVLARLQGTVAVHCMQSNDVSKVPKRKQQHVMDVDVPFETTYVSSATPISAPKGTNTRLVGFNATRNRIIDMKVSTPMCVGVSLAVAQRLRGAMATHWLPFDTVRKCPSKGATRGH